MRNSVNQLRRSTCYRHRRTWKLKSRETDKPKELQLTEIRNAGIWEAEN